MKAFEEFLHSSKQISRSLTTAIPDDVIRFLAFKDVKGGGRTVVHVRCYNIGEPELSQDFRELECETFMAADSLRTSLKVPLKEGFRNLVYI